MASRDHDSDGDSIYHAPYTAMGEEMASVQLTNLTTAAARADEEEEADQKEDRGDMQALMVPTVPRTRRHSASLKLRSTLKQVKAEFSSEKSPVVDAFIDSTKNKPKYMKDNHSDDLLV